MSGINTGKFVRRGVTSFSAIGPVCLRRYWPQLRQGNSDLIESSKTGIRRFWDHANRSAQTLEEFLERWSLVFPVILCIIVVLFGFHLASKRQLWFDEIGSTITLRSLENVSIADSLRQGIDMSPPTYFVIGKFLADVFGYSPHLFRYLSIGSTCATLLLMFLIAKRWSSAYYGCLIAVTLLHTASLLYLTEGRPYAITVAICALAIFAWDRVDTGREYGLILIMALALSAALSLHYYAVFFLLPVGLGQLARDFSKRSVTWAVWVSLVIPVVTLAAHLPLIRAGQAYYGKHAWQNLLKQSAMDLYRFLGHDISIVILAALSLFWFMSWTEGAKATQISRERWMIIVGIVLIPIAGHFSGLVVGAVPVARYLLPSVLGLALLPIMAMASWRPVTSVFRMGILAFATISSLREMRIELISQGRLQIPLGWVRENVSVADGPVVVSNPAHYLQLAYYRESERLPEVRFPDSPEKSVQYTDSDSGTLNLLSYSRVDPRVLPFRWERPAKEVWKFQVLRRLNWASWELTEARLLGGTARLMKVGDGWELFAVEIPPLH